EPTTMSHIFNTNRPLNSKPRSIDLNPKLTKPLPPLRPSSSLRKKSPTFSTSVNLPRLVELSVPFPVAVKPELRMLHLRDRGPTQGGSNHVLDLGFGSTQLGIRLGSVRPSGSGRSVEMEVG